MLLQKGSREEAVHSLINLWLKDNDKSCMYCSRRNFYEDCDTCHGKPLLGTNKEILKVFSAEMDALRSTRSNKHASTKDKSLRMAVSMPVALYQFLNTSMERLYGEKLITEEHNLNWFMKHFGKYFQVPEER